MTAEAGGLTVANVLLFNGALLVAAASPGPAFVVCVQSSLSGGRREGTMVGVGLAVVAGLWTLAALAGLELLFELFPFAFAAMKIGGALLVLAIAVQIWRGARDPVAANAGASKRRAFGRGALLNLGNPKSILFSAGVLLVIFPQGLSYAEMAFVTLNHILLEIVVYSVVALLFTRDAVRVRYLAFKPVVARAMALVLAGLGLRLLVTS